MKKMWGVLAVALLLSLLSACADEVDQNTANSSVSEPVVSVQETVSDKNCVSVSDGLAFEVPAKIETFLPENYGQLEDLLAGIGKQTLEAYCMGVLELELRDYAAEIRLESADTQTNIEEFYSETIDEEGNETYVCMQGIEMETCVSYLVQAKNPSQENTRLQLKFIFHVDENDALVFDEDITDNVFCQVNNEYEDMSGDEYECYVLVEGWQGDVGLYKCEYAEGMAMIGVDYFDVVLKKWRNEDQERQEQYEQEAQAARERLPYGVQDVLSYYERMGYQIVVTDTHALVKNSSGETEISYKIGGTTYIGYIHCVDTVNMQILISGLSNGTSYDGYRFNITNNTYINSWTVYELTAAGWQVR